MLAGLNHWLRIATSWMLIMMPVIEWLGTKPSDFPYHDGKLSSSDKTVARWSQTA